MVQYYVKFRVFYSINPSTNQKEWVHIRRGWFILSLAQEIPLALLHQVAGWESRRRTEVRSLEDMTS